MSHRNYPLVIGVVGDSKKETKKQSNHNLSIADCPPPIADCPPPIADCPPPVADCPPPIADYR